VGEPRGDGQLIEDVGNDNVLYLELRSTPRGSAVSGMTPESYVDAVLRGITQSEMAGSKVVTRFLLSINRTEPVYVYVCMCVFRFTTFIAALVLTMLRVSLMTQTKGVRHCCPCGSFHAVQSVCRGSGGVWQSTGLLLVQRRTRHDHSCPCCRCRVCVANRKATCLCCSQFWSEYTRRVVVHALQLLTGSLNCGTERHEGWG